MLHQLVDYIVENRLSTTEIADAMDKSGVLGRVLPLNRGLHHVGPIFPVFAANGSNFAVHEQIRNVPAGSVVVIFVENCDQKAIMGELMVKYMLLYRKARAVIIDGLVRDAARLYRENFSVWAQGVTPLGCVNTSSDPFTPSRQQELIEQYQGGLAVCDDGGVVLVPKSWIGPDLLTRFERIELQEDVWSFCLNSLKWDTKKIVCDKAYLDEMEVLPAMMRGQIDELRHGFKK